MGEWVKVSKKVLPFTLFSDLLIRHIKFSAKFFKVTFTYT